MSDGANKPSTKDALTVIAGAVGAAVATGMSPVATGAIAAAAGLFGVAGGWAKDRRDRRIELWYEGYLRGSEDSTTVEEELISRSGERAVREVVLEGMRAVDDVLADDVVPTLARLTREYVSSGRPADAFFRGLRRVLSDLDVDEFRSLGELMARLGALHGPVVEVHYVGLKPGEPAQLAHFRPCTEAEAKAMNAQNTRDGLGEQAHALRLFHLLKTNGLARDGAAGFVGHMAGPQVMIINVETARRVGSLIK